MDRSMWTSGDTTPAAGSRIRWRPFAAFSTPSPYRRRAYRPGWRRNSTCTAACWLAHGSFSYWIMRGMPSRRDPCSRVRRPAGRSLPAASSSPVWWWSRARTRYLWSRLRPRSRAACWLTGSARNASPQTPPPSIRLWGGAPACRWRLRSRRAAPPSAHRTRWRPSPGSCAATLITPGRDPIRLDKPHRAVTLDELSDGPQAVAWLTREHRALLAVVAQSAERKSHRHTWQLAWCLSDYFLHQGHFHDSVVTQRAALQALAQLGDEAGQARIHRVLARTYISRAANDIGESHLKQAVELSLAAGDQRGQAHSHSSLGWLYGLQGRHNEELDEAEAAARLFRATNFAIGEADALNSVGWSLAMLGRYDEALAPCEQALAVQQQQGNQTGEAAAWDSLGYIHSHQGDHGRAIAAYQRAVAIFEQMGDRLNVADTLISLGNAHTATGAGAGAATAAWERALGILEELGHPDAQRVREKLEKRAGTDP